MAVIVIFGFLTACNIFGVTWLSNSREVIPEGQVIIEPVANRELNNKV